MSRRGAALLLVLWLLVLLSGLVTVSLGGARTGSAAGRNRITLLRAAWAREACLEILLGRAASRRVEWTPEGLALDSVDLGDGVWCRAGVSDPAERLNLNLATREMLIALVRDTTLADSVIARRPWPAVEALRGLPQLRDRPLPTWAALTTVRGTGKINLNRAPPAVLGALPGVGDDGARAVVASRAVRRLHSLEEAVRSLPPSIQVLASGRFQALAGLTILEPEQLLVELSGRVRDRPLLARAIVTVVPAGSRLAVIRRESD